MDMTPEPVRYLPPLRGAVLRLLSSPGRPTADDADIAQAAGTSIDRAKAFTSILIARSAVVQVAGRYRRGPAWAQWAAMLTRCRPHKSGVREEDRRTADLLRARLAESLAREIATRGWSVNEAARRAGIHHQHVSDCLRRRVPPPAPQLILLVRAMGVTVESLAG